LPMVAFKEDSAQQIKEVADIVEVIGEHVTLQKAGINFKGLCPFHSEKTPSFSVNPQRKFFHCFGCKESGDVLSFVMKYHNMTFPDALNSLAERYGIALDEHKLTPAEQEKGRQREKMHRANDEASSLFHDFLLKNKGAIGARNYLEKRRIPVEIVSRFKLGYAPDRWDFTAQALGKAGVPADIGISAGLLVKKQSGGRVYDRFRDRIVCPIFAMSGQTAGFSGRILGDGQPKYLNTPETVVFNKSRSLFGLFQNKDAIRKAGRCLVVEGNFDLLSLVAQGLENVVAPLGTALTVQHIRILKRYTSEVVVLFDGDQAGLKAAMRSVPLFLSEQLAAKIVVLPEEHDPDTFIEAFGVRDMEEMIAKAIELPEFVFGRLVREHGLSLAGKAKIVRELQPIIASISNQQLQKSLFISHFSEKLGIEADELSGRAEFSIAQKETYPSKKLPAELVLSKQQQQLFEFLLIYPEALPRFLEAGLKKIIGHENDPAGIILMHLQELEEGEGPEVLLGKLDGAAKNFISKLLFVAPSYSAEVKETMIEEMTTWVRRQELQGRKTEILRMIAEAQHQENDNLLMELLEKKKEMDEVQFT
jgi:DNA primase